uniref:Biotin transporter BioY n=1 Tax=Candidatus Methanomethylicus mesodigestus TaxID=1867258 RepID=A0A7C3F3F0_9CREN
MVYFNSVPIKMAEGTTTIKRSRARELALCAVFAALMGAGGLISIPFYPVPFTLQTFFLYLSILVLKREAALSQAIYIAMGLAGLPIFSRGMGGYAVLIGPTGGFIIGFLLSALIAGAYLSAPWGRRSPLLALGIAMAIVFGFGGMWLGFWLGLDFYAAYLGVLPFIPGDVAKAALAFVAFKKIRM